MAVVSISQATNQFSRLIARVDTGEEVTSTRRGKAVARLVACKPRGKRRPGVLKGKAVVTDEFFDPLPEEELKLWEGG